MRNKSNPCFVMMIRTKVEDGGKKTVSGLTILDKELFVVSSHRSEIEVYDSIKLSFSRQLNVKELFGPLDIVSCNTNTCLYIFDDKDRTGQSKEILRVDPNGKLIKKWSTGEDWGYGLSVTYESNVLSVVCNKHKLREYSPDGCLICEIDLSSHAFIYHPLHAIKLTNNHFLVSHGEIYDDLHRVCIVDSDGNLTKSYGEKCGSKVPQLFKPFYLSVDVNGFVMVADQVNSRVLLLDSDLEFKREILSRISNSEVRKVPDWRLLSFPTKILLDETNGRLFVFDNAPGNPRIVVFDY